MIHACDHIPLDAIPTWCGCSPRIIHTPDMFCHAAFSLGENGSTPHFKQVDGPNVFQIFCMADGIENFTEGQVYKVTISNNKLKAEAI